MHQIDDLINKMHQFQRNSISKNLEDYHGNLDALLFIQTYLTDSKVKFLEWKIYLDTLVTKQILHCNTIYNIFNGLTLKSNLNKIDFKIFDLPSAQILIRAQLENFLIADFIYFQNCSEEEKLFRFNCWMYDSFLQRSKLILASGAINKTQESDKQEVKKLKEQIQDSPYYKKLTLPQQKELIKRGDSKLFKKWEDLMKLSELKEIIINNAYKGLSSQAHSGALSILNLKSQKLGFSKDNLHVYPLLLLSDLILCVMIVRYKHFSVTTEIAFNKLLSNRRRTIEINNSLLSLK